MENLDLLNNELQVSPVTQNYLSEVAKWGKFLSIIGFIFSGLLAIASFFIPAIYSKMSIFTELPAASAQIASVFITILYLGLALLLFFPALYLNKFSVKMKLALNSLNQENFEDSLKNLKSLFKFYGILAIILFSFYVLVFIVVMLGVAMK